MLVNHLSVVDQFIVARVLTLLITENRVTYRDADRQMDKSTVGHMSMAFGDSHHFVLALCSHSPHQLLFLDPPMRSKEKRTDCEIDGRKGRQRDRETGRQGDRETGRQGDRDRETGRQGDRETGRQRDRETERQGDRETGRQKDRDKRTDRQRHIGRQRDRQTDGETGR